MSIHAHSDDINVADWSGAAASMLATGCEDGSFKVWDLRNTPADGSSPVAYFQHHQGPLTGLQWADFESSVIATCASDNQVAFWDLAVEREEEEESSETNAEPPPDLPPQLMFVHRVR
jgi:ribosome assembly protein RRB1